MLRLAESGELPNLVFSDEKTFVVQQFVNKQNDRVYLPKRSAENVHLRLATRTQAPAMVMVWAAITADGRSPLVLKPCACKHFGRRPWTFQQDSERATQEWLKKLGSSFHFQRTMANKISEYQSVRHWCLEYFGKQGWQ